MLRRAPFRPAHLAGSALLLVALVGGALGCSSTSTTSTSTGGGSSSTATTTAPALTKEQYVTQANAICGVPKDEGDKIDKELRAKYPDPKSVPEAEFQQLMKDAVARMLPLWKKSVADLRALTPPAADAAMINTGIDKLDAAYKQIEADPSAIGKPGITSYQEGYDYGLTNCFEKATTTFSSVATAIN